MGPRLKNESLLKLNDESIQLHIAEQWMRAKVIATQPLCIGESFIISATYLYY